MSDLFTKRQEDIPQRDKSAGLSRSVDFSKLPSMTSGYTFSTPKKRSKSDVSPRAPRKTGTKDIDPDEMPLPKRLNFGSSDSESRTFENSPMNTQSLLNEVPVDYAGAMGVVGFISSYIARGGERTVPLSNLVQLISSTSMAHKTATSALMAVRNLTKAIPEWISVKKTGQSETLTFSSELRTFEVLQKLGEKKRKQLMEETTDLRASIAELRASLTKTLSLH
jgi:hypothetical protein